MGNDRNYSEDSWDKFADFTERMWIRWYSWGRDWRYRRTLKKLAILMAKDWEKKYVADSSNIRFSLIYFASDRFRYALSDNDYVLWFFVNGFSREVKIKAINHISRLLWIRFNMHPADVYNRVMVPELEHQIIDQIIGSIPEKYAKHYTFSTEPLPNYNDWEMSPDLHCAYSIVAIRHTESAET